MAASNVARTAVRRCRPAAHETRCASKAIESHIEEIDTDALSWLWNSNVRATALVLDGFVRRKDDPQFVPGLVRWLLAARRNGRWSNTQENATALESLVGYYKVFEAEIPNMTASVADRVEHRRLRDVPRTLVDGAVRAPGDARPRAPGRRRRRSRAHDDARRHRPPLLQLASAVRADRAAARARSGHARRASLRAPRRVRRRARRRRRLPPAI